MSDLENYVAELVDLMSMDGHEISELCVLDYLAILGYTILPDPLNTASETYIRRCSE